MAVSSTVSSVSNSKYLTYPEAAKFLRCSEKTLYNRVKAGKVRPFYNGRLALFTREILEASLRQESDLTPSGQQTAQHTVSLNWPVTFSAMLEAPIIAESTLHIQHPGIVCRESPLEFPTPNCVEGTHLSFASWSSNDQAYVCWNHHWRFYHL